MAPEAKFPHQLLEVEAVLTWLAKNGKARGVDPSRLCIGRLHRNIYHINSHNEDNDMMMIMLASITITNSINDNNNTAFQLMKELGMCEASLCHINVFKLQFGRKPNLMQQSDVADS